MTAVGVDLISVVGEGVQDAINKINKTTIALSGGMTVL